MISLKELILNEYSEKTITTTIDRWKNTNPNLDTNIARQVIQRFDQVKSGLSTKLQQISLSDELKQGQNYLNIDKYSWEDMVNLLRSLPEKDDKIKKDAIAKFVEEERMDKGTVASYVIRFMNNRRNLKYAIENGTEDGIYTKEQVQKLISPRLIQSNLYLDPRAYKFHQLENILDTLFPIQVTVGDEDQNTATTDADKVYDKDGLEIYKGDAQSKCISYNPTINTKKKYGWCIAQPNNSMYDRYRFMEAGNNRMFYFVFDRTKTSKPEYKPFDDPWHSFVIHVGEGNQKYWITDANNDFEKQFSPWSELQKIAPPVWKRIGGLESVFKFMAPSKAEISSAAMRGKRLSAQDFRELDYEDKQTYVQSNAGSLPKEILEVLDKELKNLAINYGQKFPYSLLKDNEGLAKRYAIFRFRHTNYGNEAISLPYVKYLDEDAKEKYLKTFDGNLTLELIEKYFGSEQTKQYVDKQVKELSFIPPSGLKYITDPKLKKFYNIYSKLFESWEYNEGTNLSDEELADKNEMPRQGITPYPISYSQWKKFSPSERQDVVKIIEKFNNNSDYIIILYSVPFLIKDGNKNYVLVPIDSSKVSEGWYLADMDGNAQEKYEGLTTNLKEIPLSIGYPDFETNFNRIYNIKDIKTEKTINEGTYRFIAEIKLPKIVNEITINNPNSLKQLMIEKGVDQEWFNKYIIQTDQLSPEELKDIEYVSDRIDTHLEVDLEEITINNPGAKILIGGEDEEFNWLYWDEDLVLDILLPIFPEEKEEIKTYVEKNNEDEVGEIEVYKQELIDDYKRWKIDYYEDDSEENIQEKFMRERLQNRAGLR